MAMQFSKEDLIYNRSIADMGVYLVINKILPNELALYNYDIMTNIETVNMNDEHEVARANSLLRLTYHNLERNKRFKNKMILEDNRIKLLEG